VTQPIVLKRHKYVMCMKQLLVEQWQKFAADIDFLDSLNDLELKFVIL
jgi:hypothetical protein